MAALLTHGQHPKKHCTGPFCHRPTGAAEALNARQPRIWIPYNVSSFVPSRVLRFNSSNQQRAVTSVPCVSRWAKTPRRASICTRVVLCSRELLVSCSVRGNCWCPLGGGDCSSSRLAAFRCADVLHFASRCPAVCVSQFDVPTFDVPLPDVPQFDVPRFSVSPLDVPK